MILDRITERQEISENTTVITVIEYPPVLEYARFTGKVYYPILEDFKTAHDIQKDLYKTGKMKGFADLLIATICINNKERLITKDTDFNDIADKSSLQVEIEA